jgi:hypothetical protein
MTASPQVLDGVASSDQGVVGDTLYLIGRPTLKEFLRYVKGHALNAPGEGDLVDAWNAAHQLVRHLETAEAGCADDPPIRKMGPEYEPLLIALLRDPMVHTFNRVPTQVALVELDRIVVHQPHIDVTFTRQLEQRLGPAPTDEELFRTCLPYDHPHPPVQSSRMHGNKFVFLSPSNDLRLLRPMMLQASHLKDYPPNTGLVGVVGMAVGFGSNFLSAIYAERRLILVNGSHRAYTLRRMGVTHVPCIIQHVASRDELEGVAAEEVPTHPDRYLTHPRPPMLKDYLNPKLRMLMRVPRRLRQVTVRFEIEEDSVPVVPSENSPESSGVGRSE